MILNTYYRVLSVFRRSCYFAVSKKQKRMLKNILLVTAVAATLFSCKKEGCMDETAFNYNSEAKKEDGSCKYETAEGYTVPTTYPEGLNGYVTLQFKFAK